MKQPYITLSFSAQEIRLSVSEVGFLLVFFSFFLFNRFGLEKFMVVNTGSY